MNRSHRHTFSAILLYSEQAYSAITRADPMLRSFPSLYLLTQDVANFRAFRLD